MKLLIAVIAVLAGLFGITASARAASTPPPPGTVYVVAGQRVPGGPIYCTLGIESRAIQDRMTLILNPANCVNGIYDGR